LVCVENRNGRSSVRVTPAGFEILKKFRPERVLHEGKRFDLGEST